MGISKHLNSVSSMCSKSGIIFAFIGPLLFYSLAKSAVLSYPLQGFYLYKEALMPGEAAFFDEMAFEYTSINIDMLIFDVLIIASILLSIVKVMLDTSSTFIDLKILKRSRIIEIRSQAEAAKFYSIKKAFTYILFYAFVSIGYFVIIDFKLQMHDQEFNHLALNLPYAYVSLQLFCLITLNVFSSEFLVALIADFLVLIRIYLYDD